MFINLAILAVIVTVATARSPPANWRAVETLKLGRDEVIHVNIALKPKDGELLEKALLEISTPGTANFRKYLKKEQITNIVGRSNEDITRFADWIYTTGAARDFTLSPHRDWIHAKLSISQIEKLFECELVTFENTKTSATKIGARDGIYSIPEEMKDLIEMVSGMTTFTSGHLKVALNSAKDQKDTASIPADITPDTIYENYQSPNTGYHNSKLGSQAVIEFGRFANFNDEDTETFFTKLAPSLKGETCEAVYGGNDGDSKPSVEANLDVQYIMAAGPFINTTSYKITTSSFGESIEDEFLDYTMLVNSQNEPPLVHSISYGEYGGSYDNATDQRFSYELQKMGISGISVLLASGDNGVGCDSLGTTQEFDYPSSPYITMVGATYIDKSTKEEVGATLSSGGFSKDFYQPSWQADAVNGYFQSGAKMPSEDFYPMGRAYPDVAAYGQNVQVVASGTVEGVSGTSCSAPIFAGLVAQLNDELMQKGEAPLGFLNPWLYANPSMFTDVVSGSNPYQKCDGFFAAKGWDPVTGLGTPIYPKMKDASRIT